jgi:ATP-binding cassette subfamily C (CFTR/MRP) protein 1
MADPGQEKDEYAAADMAAAENTTNAAEPLDDTGEDKDYIKVTSHGDPSSHGSSEKGSEENEKRRDFHRSKSYATNTSEVTRTESHVDEPPKKKPWYKNLNPLKWGKVPPVPETRQVSREYNAPFLSIIYFQWMAPLMSVSLLQAAKTSDTDHNRLAIDGNWNWATSGQ